MRAFPVTLLLLSAVAFRASAQVGHPPDQSPFRDIPSGHIITPFVGFVGGGGGPFGIGPHNGTIFGGRYDVRANRSMGIGLSVAHGKMDRLIVDPFVTLARRTTGPVQQPVTFVDLGVQLNLTGGKTWHRLAPFAGLSGGMAFAGSTAADTSGFKFGSKFYASPGVGTRVFITSRLMLRAEVRGVFWKLTYPPSFASEPIEEPGTEDNPNAVIPNGDLRDWVLTPWLQIGVGYLVRW